MAIYVDPLMNHGWILRGRAVENCHLFTDAVDLEELHALAERIGMRRAWFQPHHLVPHYDLTPGRRRHAIVAGAIAVDCRQAVVLWRTRRAVLTEVQAGGPASCDDVVRLAVSTGPLFSEAIALPSKAAR